MVQDFPDVRFFAATDWLVTLNRDVGVSGSYDVLVYMNPPLVLNMYELCRQGNFAEAMPLQEKLQHFYRIVEELGFLQYSDSAIDRCIGLSTGFLKGYTQAVKKPYSTVPEHMLDTLKARVANELPELLEY
jgi:dihydrodipicolinate synthase/N-acetylneuraminate lyase